MPRRAALLGGLAAAGLALAAPGRLGESLLAAAMTTGDEASGTSGSAALSEREANGPADSDLELQSPLLIVRVKLQPFRLSFLTAAGGLLQTQEPPAGVTGGDWPSWQFAVGGDDSGASARWHRLTSAAVASRDDAARMLRLRVASDDPAGRAALVTLDLGDPGVARATVQVAGPGVTRLAAQFAAPPDEHFFGFGSHSDRVDFRGARVENVLIDRVEAAGGRPKGDPDLHGTYAAVPFWLTNRGYGVLLGNAAPTSCDLTAARADALSIEAQGATLDYQLLAGPKPLDVLERFTAHAGRPPLPPPWPFGVWKTALGGTDAVLAEARRLRALQIPVSALFCYDIADATANLGWPHHMYAGAPTGAYPDIAALSGALHALGFSVLGYLNCFFQPGSPAWQEAEAGGYLLKAPNGATLLEPAMHAAVLDVTNPKAVAWWQGTLRRVLTDLDLDGWMQDFGDTTPDDAIYADGSDPVAMHNRYPVLYAKAAYEEATQDKPDFVFFMRSGYTGVQPYQRAVWPGDQVDNWDSQWGLPAAVRASINEGIAGMPFGGSDIGGYAQGQEVWGSERELWLRWAQFGAFSPVMRDLLGRKPTGDPVDLWTDAATIAVFRNYAALHVALYPYFASLARTAHETGAPLIRHLALTYPDDPAVYGLDDEYLLGDAFLVAPVVAPGAASRCVYLPAGDWVDFWNREQAPGGRWQVLATPLDLIPVYARAGAIIPTLPAGVQTLAPASDPSVAAASAELPELNVEVYPCPGGAATWASDFTLHDGTALAFRMASGTYSLGISGGLAGRRYTLTLPADAAPHRVMLHGRALPRLAAPEDGANGDVGWLYQKGRGLVIVARASAAGDLTATWA